MEYFYFEAFNETWKARFEGPQGAHWGVWDQFGNLKPGMQAVFNNQTIPDNWNIDLVPGGPGSPTIEFTFVPPRGSFQNLEGRALHINPFNFKVAVYIFVRSGWWIKPFFDRPLTSVQIDGSWRTDITTGGTDEQATELAAFLIPTGYNPPLLAGQSILPQELFDNAIASVQEGR